MLDLTSISKMRRTLIFKSSVILAVVMASLACNDLKLGDASLEKAPGVDVTIDTVFSSKLYADRALVSAYATLRCGFPVHNNAWPLNSQGTYQYDSENNVMGNDVLDSITDCIESHCTWGGVRGTYYSGQYNAETENESGATKMGFIPTKSNAWVGIRKAFIYIHNVDRVPDMTEEEKTRGKGEAYMIIAIHYLDLLRHYGGIPILKTDVKPGNDSEIDFTRRPVQEVIDYIIELCDTAAEMLPWTVEAHMDGHLTKASALGLKCRALSFIASPLFNSNAPYSSHKPAPRVGNIGKVDESLIESMYWLGGYDEQRWQAVADACEAFFSENEAKGSPYTLVESYGSSVDGYRYAWSQSYVARYNGEILIATGRHYSNFADTYLRCFFGPSDDHGNTGRGHGGGCVTLNMVDMFCDMNTGLPSSYRDWISSHNGQGKVGQSISNITPFEGKDPRLYESVMIVGDHFRGRAAEMWIGGREREQANNERAITGFCSRKFFRDYDDETFMSIPTNYAFLRLSDIYLIYAEALNELGRKAEALAALNAVRTRVGMPLMTDALLDQVQGGKTLPSYPELSKGDSKLREEILDERVREFYFEESRWYDIIRWKREDIFRKDLYGIDITVVSGSWESNDLILNFSEPHKLQDRYWKNNWDSKWYLSAFPSDEINKGYGLVQNPGW